VVPPVFSPQHLTSQLTLRSITYLRQQEAPTKPLFTNPLQYREKTLKPKTLPPLTRKVKTKLQKRFLPNASRHVSVSCKSLNNLPLSKKTYPRVVQWRSRRNSRRTRYWLYCRLSRNRWRGIRQRSLKKWLSWRLRMKCHRSRGSRPRWKPWVILSEGCLRVNETESYSGTRRNS